jgi:hypothetical protein
VTFAGDVRTVTIALEAADFDQLEALAKEANIGNATLGRAIIHAYLIEQKCDAERERDRQLKD